MEPITAIVTALALGAATAAKDVGSQAVKDAYEGLKALITSHYPKVSVVQLEQRPESKSRRGVVEEDLQANNAADDTELVMAARELIDLIQKHSPGAAAAVGVDLTDVKAASLRVSDIAATGSGVKVKHGEFKDDISISGVQVGILPKGQGS